MDLYRDHRGERGGGGERMECWSVDVITYDIQSFPFPFYRALLKYANESEKAPKWTSAWSTTQPKPIFASEVDEQDGNNNTDGQGKGSGQQ